MNEDERSNVGLSRLEEAAKKIGLRYRLSFEKCPCLWVPKPHPLSAHRALRAAWPGLDSDGRIYCDSASDLAHEIAHFQVADAPRRLLPYYGLGAFGEARFADHPNREECRASLLGIFWLRAIGNPDWTMTVLDHNWAERWSRLPKTPLGYMRRLLARKGTARCHLLWLRKRGFLDSRWRPTLHLKGQRRREGAS